MGKDKWILFTPRKVVVFLLFVVLICTFIEVLTSTTESEKSEKEAVSTTETVIGEIESQLSIEIDTVDLAKLSESLESVLKQGQFYGVALVDQQDQVISSAISHGRRRPDQVSKTEAGKQVLLLRIVRFEIGHRIIVGVDIAINKFCQ